MMYWISIAGRAWTLVLLTLFSLLSLYGDPGAHTAVADEDEEVGQIFNVNIRGLKYLELPDAANVEWIRVDLVNSPSYHPNIYGFELPKEHYSAVLELIEAPKVETQVTPYYSEIGSLLIKSKDKAAVRVSWYWKGKGELLYSVNGIRCFSGTYQARQQKSIAIVDEGIALDGFLRKVHKGVLPITHK